MQDQFAVAWDCSRSLCHPCPGCDGVGRKGNLCPGCASVKSVGASYFSWTCQHTFSSVGFENVPEILVRWQARLGHGKGRGFVEVSAAKNRTKCCGSGLFALPSFKGVP